MKIGILMGLILGNLQEEQTAQVLIKYTLQAEELFYPKLILTPQSQTYLRPYFRCN